MPTKSPPRRVSKARSRPPKRIFTGGPGANEVYISQANIQMTPPITISVNGSLNPPGGTVHGHLWDVNGNELQGNGANPVVQADPVTGKWTMQFNLPNGTQGEFALKVVYLDSTDPASDTQEVTLGPPPPPPPGDFAKRKRIPRK